MRWLDWILRKRLRRAETPSPPPSEAAPRHPPPPIDDFVARYGRSYAEPGDPVSYNAKVEVAKALRKPNGRAR
jgi:hypothetical protein